jgi:ligand-binding sensor domain-containing protein
MRAKCCARMVFSLIAASGLGVCGQGNLALSFHKKFGPDNGLSSYNVSKIIQDRFGFIWAATQDGLNRFGGKDFIIYSKSAPERNRILGNAINDIVEDTSRNLLWLTSSYSGLNAVDLRTGKVELALAMPKSWTRCINVTKKYIWLGGNGGLQIFDPQSGKLDKALSPTLTKGGIKNAATISFIFVDQYGHVWANYVNYGLRVYDASSKKLLYDYPSRGVIDLDQKDNLEFTSRLAPLGDSAFVIGTDRGFRLVRYNAQGLAAQSREDLPLNAQFGQTQIFSCAVDGKEKLWFSTPGHLYRADAGLGSFLDVKDIAQRDERTWFALVQCILVDNEENLWVGGEKGIAFSRNIKPAFLPFNKWPGSLIEMEHVTSLFAESDSLVWVCTQDGFYRVNCKSDLVQLIQSGSGFDFCFKSKTGTVIISGNKGTFAINKANKVVPIGEVYPELKALNHEGLNSAVEWKDTLLVLGSPTMKGICLWNTRAHNLHQVIISDEEGTASTIENLYSDHQGRIWVLCDDGIGICDPEKGIVEKIGVSDPQGRTPLSLFFDMCEGDGDFWLALYGKGIIRMDSARKIKKIYSTDEGLTNTGVYKLFPYKDSLLFVSSNNGLFEINMRSDRVKEFNQEDGLNSSHFEERAGFIDGNTFYVGGVNGFSMVLPENIQPNLEAPLLYIDRVTVESASGLLDSSYLGLARMTLPPSTIETNIYFSAIYRSDPGRSHFAYKVQEIDTNWIPLKERHLPLTGLKPGTYHVRLRASNEDGSYSVEKEIILVLQPHWYQTWWFNVMIIVVIIATVLGLFRYKVDELKRHQQIRKDLASDLHDDLGSTLNAVKVFTHLARKEPGDPTHLNQIEESLTEASLSLRDMIWVLDDNRDNVGGLIERIQKFAVPLTRAKGIGLECVISEETKDKKISKTEKRNLLLIAKEAINNAVKYAECQIIKIDLSTVHGHCALCIEDDGVGFNRDDPPAQGQGLKNIVHRAHQIHRSAKITSQAGRGTKVQIGGLL